MSVRVVRTSTEEETIALGELGAGKTTLAKGIVQGLGAASHDDVTSPTFTLIHEFGEKVYHIDLYRLETAREVQALGLDELIDSGGVLLVEWGERFPALWPRDHIEIRLEWVDETVREITQSGSLSR